MDSVTCIACSVVVAHHEITGHKVAIKILNRRKIHNSGKRDMVEREISILRKMRHTHVNRLYAPRIRCIVVRNILTVRGARCPP
jgi:serine/threonine protein kinase